MGSRISWKQGKLILAIVLLVMVLMRLVWMQLRQYPAIYDFRTYVNLHFLQDHRSPDCVAPASAIENLNLYSLSEGSNNSWAGLYWSPAREAYLGWACLGGSWLPGKLVSYNQSVLIAVVFLCALISRFLSGSWLIALMSAAVLLSRGRLITDLGIPSGRYLETFFFSLWMTCVVHYFRTASLGGLWTAMAMALFLGFFQSYWLSLNIVLFILPLILIFFQRPVIITYVTRLREERRQAKMMESDQQRFIRNHHMMSRVRAFLGFTFFKPSYLLEKDVYKSGNFLKSIPIPWGLWIWHEKRWAKVLVLTGVSGLVTVICGFLLEITRLSSSMFEFKPESFTVYELWDWLFLLTLPIDFDLIVALLIIITICIQRPRYGFLSIYESCWTLMLALLVVAFFALVADMLIALHFAFPVVSPIYEEFPKYWVRASEVILVFEPVILTIGFVGFFHLFKVADSKLMEWLK